MGLEDLSRLPFYHYQRFDDPTWSLLEHKIAAAEGGETALVFATGMAAVSAALMLNVSAGDELLFHLAIYGNTHALVTGTLPRFGIKSKGLDFGDESALAEAINEHTRIVYFETPVNPLVNLVDIAAVRRIVDEAEERLGQKINSDYTVIIVSHNMKSLKNLCNKVVWIEDGRTRKIGPPDAIIDAYIKGTE